MNYIIEYTYPEQYIIYLNDNELSIILKDVISDEISTNNIIGKKVVHKEGSKLDALVELIFKQFKLSYLETESYVKATIYKEAAKRWLKKTMKF